MSDRYPSAYDGGGHWRRWEPESFDAPPPTATEPAATPEPAPALPDPAEVLAEIERLRQTAIERGHAEGYAAGHAQGHEAGLREGREQGLIEGRDTGYAEGYAQGLETARAEAEQLKRIVETCTAAVENFEAEAGEALISLALRVAEQVLHSTLNAEPERIVDLVRDVLQVEGSHQGLLRLRLNPDDLELVDRYLQEDGTVSQWRLLADPAIERGGCIVETALGNIDATLQTRWQRVVSALGTRD